MTFDFDKLKTLIRKYVLECFGGVLMFLSVIGGGVGGITVIIMTITGTIDVEDSGGILLYILKLIAILAGSALAFILGLYLLKKVRKKLSPKLRKISMPTST